MVIVRAATAFETHARDYDLWFAQNTAAYQAGLRAPQTLKP